MDFAVRPQRKILRSPSVKRKSKILPVNQRVQLERVLGVTVSSNAGLSCDPNHGTIAYPAGCVTVLFNPRRNKQSHIFNVTKKTITSVAFSKDGRHLVTGEMGHQPAVRIWDVEEKTQVAEYHGHKFGISCVTFSPNQKEIVSVGTQHDMMINVWNWRSGNKVASNKVSSKVAAIAYSEDGKCFVTVGNRHVKFWYLEDRRSKINQTMPLMGRSGILGDQKDNFFCDVASGQGNQTGRFFVITQAGLLCEFNEKRLLDKWVELRTKSANCITAGSEHIFIGCSEGVVRVFSAATLHYLCSLPKPHYLGVEVTTATSPSHMVSNCKDVKYPDAKAIAFDDDHKKVTCIYNDRSVYIWDVHDLKHVGKAWSFLYHSGCIWALEVYPPLDEGVEAKLPPGSFLTSSGDDTIRVWNLNTHMPENTAYRRNIYSNELLKIVYSDPTLNNLCNVDYNPAGVTDKTDTSYDGKSGVRSIRVSPDGADLASGDRQGNIRIYDMKYLNEKRSIEAHESDVMCLEYSKTQDGNLLATASRDRLIHVFDVDQNYGLLQTLADHSSSITSVRFTNTDQKLRMISCGADKSILFRNAVTSPDFQFQLEHHLATKISLYDMVIDPTQKYLATAGQDRNVRLYNINTTKEKKCYRGSLGDDGTLLRIQLDPSGIFAATSCTDKNVCIIDFASGEILATMNGHSDVITGVKFANDLKRIITVSADGCIFVWKLPADLTSQIKSRLVELGKCMKETDIMKSDQQMMPNPVVLDGMSRDGVFPVVKSASISHIPFTDDDSVDGRETEDFDIEDEGGGSLSSGHKGSFDDTASQASLDYRFSIGQLPNWAKAKFGGGSTEGSESSQEMMVQPKGRWAQRVDHKVEFKSQLDLTSEDDSSTDRRKTIAFDSSQRSHLSDFRRETMVLNGITPKKGLPVVGDDLRASTGDLRSSLGLAPQNLAGKGKTPKTSKSFTPNKSDTTLNIQAVAKKWTDQFDFLKQNSMELDDTDDLDTGSDTTEVIYPPTDSDSDVFGSSYKVFAVDDVGKKKSRQQRESLGNADDASESTDPISIDDDEDPNDTTILSNPTTPSDPEKEFLARTPEEKDDFMSLHFEENFTPVPLEKFTKSIEMMENQVEGSAPKLAQAEAMPFSPRLSLSARFMSRSVQKSSVLQSGYRQDNWFNRNKMEMSRTMDETRKSLLAMNLRSISPEQSPEKEEPPSPPSKIESSNSKCPELTSCSHPYSSSTPAEDKSRDFSKSTRSPQAILPSRSTPPNSSSPLAKKIQKERDRRRSSSAKPDQDRRASDGADVPPKDPGPGKARVRPSYFRPTQSSKNKVNKGETDSGGPNDSNNPSDPVKKKTVKTRGRMTRSNLYASSPNLFHDADADDDEEEEETAKPKKSTKCSSSSNLQSLADLSRSVPDVNDAGSSTDSNSSGPTSKPMHKSVFGPAAKLTTRYMSGLTDKSLMPPPSSTGSLGRKMLTKPESHKATLSEMTLDQAKSILLGKSGILGNKPTNTSITVATVGHSDGTSTSAQGSSDLTQTAMGPASAGVEPLSLSQLAVAEEIEQTADMLHQQKHNPMFSPEHLTSHPHRTNLEASPLDLPERDQPSSLKKSPNPRSSSYSLSLTSSSEAARYTVPASTFHTTSSTILKTQIESPMCKSDDHGNQNGTAEDHRSVKERIARYDTKKPPIDGSPLPASVQTLTQKPGRSSSPHRRILPASPNVAPDLRDSPRSQADTGLGSESDTDTQAVPRNSLAASTSITNKDSGNNTTKADRSKLALPISISSSSEQVQTCKAALDDLRSQLSKLKELFTQVDGRTDETSRQILSMMGDVFHEAQSVISELASKTPSPVTVISNNPISSSSSSSHSLNKTFHVLSSTSSSGKTSASSSSSSCSPPVEGQSTDQPLDPAQISMLAATKEMLQPLISQLSQDLSGQIVQLVREQMTLQETQNGQSGKR